MVSPIVRQCQEERVSDIGKLCASGGPGPQAFLWLETFDREFLVDEHHWRNDLRVFLASDEACFVNDTQLFGDSGFTVT
jgi:hypothetical protein